MYACWVLDWIWVLGSHITMTQKWILECLDGVSRDNAFIPTPIPCFSFFFFLPAFHIILFCGSKLSKPNAHTSRIHEDFTEIHRQALFVCLFSTNYQICNFCLYSFLNLICIRTYLMVLLFHIPFSHLTEERLVSNSLQDSPWFPAPRCKKLLDKAKTPLETSM